MTQKRGSVSQGHTVGSVVELELAPSFPDVQSMSAFSSLCKCILIQTYMHLDKLCSG